MRRGRRTLNVTDVFFSTGAVLIGAEPVVALVLVALLVRYEYLRRVADIRMGRQVVVTGLLAAVMLVLFTGLIIRRVLNFLMF